MRQELYKDVGGWILVRLFSDGGSNHTKRFADPLTATDKAFKRRPLHVRPADMSREEWTQRKAK